MVRNYHLCFRSILSVLLLLLLYTHICTYICFGFIKGYALIEYESFEEAEKAISAMDGAELLTQIINVDWAFSHGPIRRKNARYASLISLQDLQRELSNE